MTTFQESWLLMAAAALGGATVGFAVAIQIARSHGNKRLRQAINEIDQQWSAVVARHRAERVNSELQLQAARTSLGRPVKAAIDQAPSAAPLAPPAPPAPPTPPSQPKPPEVRAEVRAEGVRINVLMSSFLGQESDDIPSAFAETQPMHDDDLIPVIKPRRSRQPA
jgi:hypothetical protein